MKIVSILFSILFSVSVFAETDYLALDVIQDIQKGADNRNQIDKLRVRTDVILPAGVIGTSEISDSSISAAKIGTVSQVYTGTAAIATTSYTPSFIGQLLVGTVSNTVHVSENLTTNGWIQISN